MCILEKHRIILGGAVLYYSPVSQKALGRGEPDWDYSVLEEVQIPGMSNDDFIEKTETIELDK